MALLNLLLPPACAGCGGYGSALCAACVSEFRPPGRDEERFLVADPGVVVGEHLAVAVAAFAYEGALRHALQRVKYVSAARAAEVLATASLGSFLRLARLAGDATLVPVPLHDERRRERGFNQAELVARALGRATGLPVSELLARRHATARQHGLDRAARLRNLAGAFEVRHDLPLSPRVIVVDDILTTSATLESCASVLVAAGAERVFGFALAREI